MFLPLIFWLSSQLHHIRDIPQKSEIAGAHPIPLSFECLQVRISLVTKDRSSKEKAL